jgi:hypothetical protein
VTDRRFRTEPKPNNEVIELLERTLEAARHGRVPYIAIIAGNPVNEVQPLLAGDLSTIRANALLGGLARAANNLLKE